LVALDAAPLKDEFVKLGLGPDFIEDLKAASAEFDTAISRRIQNTESRVAPTATVKGLLRECLETLRELDPSCETSSPKTRGPRRMGERQPHGARRAPREIKRAARADAARVMSACAPYKLRRKGTSEIRVTND
jgi:hypothetical protein